MQVRVGTSGYSYKPWKGVFYPEDLPDSRMLEHYATRLDTVEINYTFRRFPSEKAVAGWGAAVPGSFAFSLKAHMRITHKQRLKECRDNVTSFAARVAPLGERVGATLFQLPPYLKQDLDRLRTFLADVPPALCPVMEFRHDSWFADEVYDALREHGAALVVSDTDGAAPPPLIPTTDRGYLRLRRDEYDRAALEDWAKRIADQPWERVLVYFKHEEKAVGPRLALEFRELL